jgi:hypothetical protein
MVFDFEYLEQNDRARIQMLANESDEEGLLQRPAVLDSSFDKP